MIGAVAQDETVLEKSRHEVVQANTPWDLSRH